MVLMKRKEMEKVSSLVKSPIQYSMQKTLLQYAMDKIYFVVLQKRTEASSSSSLQTRYVHESQVSLPNPAETAAQFGSLVLKHRCPDGGTDFSPQSDFCSSWFAFGEDDFNPFSASCLRSSARSLSSFSRTLSPSFMYGYFAK